MNGSVSIQGLRELVADFDKIEAEIPKTVKGVVGRGAFQIKADARRRASGLRHAPYYPNAIGYDTFDRAHRIWAEIGPDKAKPQGALGNLIEYGSVNNAPIPHLSPALDAEAPKFERAMGDAIQDLVNKA